MNYEYMYEKHIIPYGDIKFTESESILIINNDTMRKFRYATLDWIEAKSLISETITH